MLTITPTPTFLETLKNRQDEAQQRFTEITQRLQATQTEHQLAAQELAGWQTSYKSELKKEQARAAAQAATQSAPDSTRPPSAMALPELAIHTPVIVQAQPGTDASEISKAALVRDVLKRNNGIRPIDLWKTVKDQIPNRTYVYSVLKRLKDKNEPEVLVRKGKYYFRAIPKVVVEESKDMVH